MAKKYSVNELVDFAVQIEEEGAVFYQDAAKKTKNADFKKLYEFLRNEELEHEKKYQAMLNEVDRENPGTVYNEDYHQYLRAFVENVVFDKRSNPAGDLTDDLSIIDFAVNKEKDSILFYKEMLNFLPSAGKAIVDQIIQEEQQHILKLLDIREQVA